MHNRLLFPFSLFLLSACSYTPWQESPLSPEQVGSIPLIVEELQKDNCGNGFDADAIITLNTKLGNHSYQGYLAALRPHYGKFVVTSPLGQPLFIASATSEKLTLINVRARNYSQEHIPLLLQKHDLPSTLVAGGVANILGGYISQDFVPPYTFYSDKENRGIWVKTGESHEMVLIAPEKKQVVARRISDNGKELDIEYSYSVGECLLPKEISISGLSYGSSITVQLKKGAKSTTFTPSQFAVQPPSFFREVKLN